MIDIENKWRTLIDACKSYYIDSEPTGMSDAEYDKLEKQALIEDNFSVRDYIFQKYLKGTKGLNAYIEKIKKEPVEQGNTMANTIRSFEANINQPIYVDLKYDGSSIAIYLDPRTGKPIRILTVGNSNMTDYGVDQTSKLINFLPDRFPIGIVAIQSEALIDVSRFNGDPERARQKANGLINSKYCEDEVNNLLTLRAYRYYTDDSPEGIAVSRMDYKTVLNSFPVVTSQTDGHILFSPADVFTTKELGDWCEKDIINTSTGTFLADGMVLYDEKGKCIKAVKFSGAGNDSEKQIKTKVIDIIWNDQTSKGKDSWSANVLIEPVTVRGVEIRKPSAGSVGKLIKNHISKGAEVTIILANSTIPMVYKTITPGKEEIKFPVCKCGYQMGPQNIYGTNLKCGNPMCSNRLKRMKNYLSTVSNQNEIDLNKLLVIDRFDWNKTDVNICALMDLVRENKEEDYFKYLSGFLGTDLQLAILSLVWKVSFLALSDYVNKD